MNKTCARCNKVVYPIEELKCLDKVCVFVKKKKEYPIVVTFRIRAIAGINI